MHRQARCAVVGLFVLQREAVGRESDILHDSGTAEEVQIYSSYHGICVRQTVESFAYFSLHQPGGDDISAQKKSENQHNKGAENPQCDFNRSFHDASLIKNRIQNYNKNCTYARKIAFFLPAGKNIRTIYSRLLRSMRWLTIA